MLGWTPEDLDTSPARDGQALGKKSVEFREVARLEHCSKGRWMVLETSLVGKLEKWMSIIDDSRMRVFSSCLTQLA